ncbi:hypothetical protein TNCV_4998951 [Trichonephila clavipes]|nr:hypothetical protein TNCV_4998951 [Trichonephila clavipes]
MSSLLVLSDGDTRNRWRDGQVCPDVGQGTMAPWARRLGREGGERKKTGRERREKRKKRTERRRKEERKGEREDRKREESRGERERSPPCMEKRVESGDWSEKDDERRWR